MSKTILYARVSTVTQTIDHQLTQAQAAGFKIDDVVADHGVSGVRTALADRPQGKRLFDMLRRGDTLVVRWVDRLGRDYLDVTDTIRQFMRQGVVIRTVINGLTFDGATKDAMQQAIRDALIAFMAASAQAQAEAAKEAQRAGIAHARAVKESGKGYMGRKPSYDSAMLESVIGDLASDVPVIEIARRTALTRQTVMRIRADPEAARSLVAKWGL